MCRRAVEVVVALLHVFAMVAFVAGEAEQPLLQDRVAAIPEREREADALMAIADAGKPILIPAVRIGSREIVREILPGCASCTVVLTHCAPGTLAEVRPPALPVDVASGRFLQSQFFSCHVLSPGQ